jgi:hypothetical protein
MWIMFMVPCPTPDGQSAEDLYAKRIPWITPELRASAVEHGCRFHRAWYAADGHAFYALADWVSREGAIAFFEKWQIEAELGEVAIQLEGDVGLVPVP